MTHHQPERTCITCKKKGAKHELLRIVRTCDNKIEIDVEFNKPGRGAYLCLSLKCMEIAYKKNLITRHLKMKPPPDFPEDFIRHINDSKRSGF